MSSAKLEAFLTDGDTAFQRRAERMPEPPAKPCIVCGALFSRKPTEERNRFAKRSTCSQACEAHRRILPKSTRSQPRPPKVLPERCCPVCGVTFGPGKGECLTQFQQRRTCSARCGATLRWRDGRRRMQPPEPSDEELDRRAEIILARMAEQAA